MKNLALLLGACALAFSAPVSAGSLTVLHTFTGKSDGMTPFAGLTADGQGNFYGTTYEGGGKNCYPNGCGTVYRIAADGSFMSLYAFKGGTDGAYLHAGLTLGPDGALYGVTQGGGNLDACVQVGCGTLFRLTSDGTKTTLYKFKGGTGDGEEPNGAVVFDRKGNLYGTTWFGGDIGSGYGTIYKRSPEGQETMLYAFKDDAHDGMEPMGKLAVDNAGNLYGTTRVGGSAGAGTVFKLTDQGEESLLYVFKGPDGDEPLSDLLIDNAGNLYGTTLVGGAFDEGTVFMVTPTGIETVLHSFSKDGTDGILPGSRLISDAKGNLYGTAGGGPNDWGVVFKLAPDGTETIVASFTNSKRDGSGPAGGVVREGHGRLYGTAPRGGSFKCSNGCGTIFRITP